MNVHHTLICLFFFMLQDGNFGLINAEIPIFRGTKGQNITVKCNFTRTGSRKYFCKNKCNRRLITMTGVSHKKGRYRMRYETTHTGSRLDVTITKLRKSDSGRYGCGLDKYAVIDPYQQFEIIVTDGPSTSTPKMTTRPFLTSARSANTKTPPTPTQSFRRSSTSSTFSAQTTNLSEKEQTAGGSGVLLYVCLTLVIIVLLSSVAVLILCKKRTSKPKEHPDETECDNVTEASPVYEEIREGDGQSRSPPVENSVEASAVYSLVTATASCPLSKTEDDLTEVDYTEVHLSNRAAVSLSSAPSGQVDNVIYSTPQTYTDAKVASQPLSTVTLPQQ